MMRLILLLPFAIELPFDGIYLPKHEIKWYERLILMTACVATATIFADGEWYQHYALSLAPYCFFDIALAVWLHGWRKWYKLGDTKRWDRLLSSLNPWFLLVLRAFAFVGLLWVGL